MLKTRHSRLFLNRSAILILRIRLLVLQFFKQPHCQDAGRQRDDSDTHQCLVNAVVAKSQFISRIPVPQAICPPPGPSAQKRFRAQGDALAADRRINALMRPKIVEALARKGVTRYKLCKDLNLNPGNVYAYLAGDDAKASKEAARRMLRYAEG